eukprot:Gb_16555 [translate_table: standard]
MTTNISPPNNKRQVFHSTSRRIRHHNESCTSTGCHILLHIEVVVFGLEKLAWDMKVQNTRYWNGHPPFVGGILITGVEEKDKDNPHWVRGYAINIGHVRKVEGGDPSPMLGLFARVDKIHAQSTCSVLSFSSHCGLLVVYWACVVAISDFAYLFGYFPTMPTYQPQAESLHQGLESCASLSFCNLFPSMPPNFPEELLNLASPANSLSQIVAIHIKVAEVPPPQIVAIHNKVSSNLFAISCCLCDLNSSVVRGSSSTCSSLPISPIPSSCGGEGQG